MTDEQAGAAPEATLEDLTAAQLQEKIDELNEENADAKIPRTGTKADLIERIEAATAAPDDEDEPEAEEEGAESPAEGDAPANHSSPVVPSSGALGAAQLGVMTDPDGVPLPQLHPEPADVAGPGGEDDRRDTTAVAAHDWQARQDADALARTALEAQAVQAPTDEELCAAADGGDEEAALALTQRYGTDIDPDEYETWGAWIEAQPAAPVVFMEHTLPDKTTERIIAWAEDHPDATVIPPDLLPPAYRDGTIPTPGIPPL